MKTVQAEEGWVRRIRTGDGAAFELLFGSYCQPLIRFVRRYVGDTTIAEDLVQDVFLAVWRKWQGYVRRLPCSHVASSEPGDSS